MLRTAARTLQRLALVSLVASGAPPAWAADPPAPADPGPTPTDPTARAEWLSNQAEVAFSEKRFADAIRLYLDAWEAAPAASILYNVAFIYDKRLDDAELAIDYYERAATSPDADDELKTKARARVAALRTQKPPIDKPPIDKPPIEPPPDTGSSVGPWIVTATGGALFLGGAVMGFIASSTQSDFESAADADEKRSLQSQGKTEALVADVLMGAGVLAIGVGVVWMIVDSGSSGEGRVEPVGSNTWIEPRLVPGGAALVVGGAL